MGDKSAEKAGEGQRPSNVTPPSAENPMSYLGLRRRNAGGDDDSDATPVKKVSGVELNLRGIPARKRKKNSLIFGDDDLVSIPIKSPKKRGPKSEKKKTDSPGKSSQENVSTPPTTPSKRLRIDLRPSSAKKLTASAKKAKIKLDKKSDKSSMTRTPNSTKKNLSRRFSEDSDDVVDDDSDDITGDEDEEDFDLEIKPEPEDDDDDEDYRGRGPKGTPRVTSGKKKKPTGKRAAAMVAAAIANAGSSADGSESELTSPEKQNAASLGVALRNLLKLPKAHRWVCFEFFYSNLDKVLFDGENDFMVCLKESFPLLQTRRLTRVEWSKIRRLMGKPRRCSAAFFAEERAELGRKRQKIRMLQQRKQADVTSFKDMPENIPLQLTIGARVTARLRKPQDGLFMGTVDAYDTSNNTYRIRFDRGALTTYSIPDEEVLSVDEPEMLPLSSFTAKARPRPQPHLSSSAASVTPFISPMKFGPTYSPQLANDPLLSGSTPRGKVMRMDGHVGVYPTKFLEQIVRLSKSLKLKRECVNALRELNKEGERKKSFGEIITEDFQRRYASTVIELANINRDLNEHLRLIQDYTQQYAPECAPTISLPNIIREGCQEDAYDMVNKNNVNNGNGSDGHHATNGDTEDKDLVDNPKILTMISSFTALMLQVKLLAEGERNAFELQALQDSLTEVKQSLAGENLIKFENHVEVHLQHIVSGLTRLGNLHAFMVSSAAATTAGSQQPKEVTVKSDPG